jgi:hypothetical protein
MAGMLISMRRITGVVGAALVVLGFLGLMGAASAEVLAPWWFVFILMVPIGFGLIWEAQITWPRDGSAYPWRNRLAGLIIGLVALASAAATRGVLMATLPDHWIADSLAMGAGGMVGLFVFRRLPRRKAV